LSETRIPDDLLYSEQDEWARREGDRVTVGITDYAQQQLGDVVFVELPACTRAAPRSGDRVGEGGVDLYAPVTARWSP
jgi:glycine cleavage system H protein